MGQGGAWGETEIGHYVVFKLKHRKLRRLPRQSGLADGDTEVEIS